MISYQKHNESLRCFFFLFLSSTRTHTDITGSFHDIEHFLQYSNIHAIFRYRNSAVQIQKFDSQLIISSLFDFSTFFLRLSSPPRICTRLCYRYIYDIYTATSLLNIFFPVVITELFLLKDFFSSKFCRGYRMCPVPVYPTHFSFTCLPACLPDMQVRNSLQLFRNGIIYAFLFSFFDIFLNTRT